MSQGMLVDVRSAPLTPTSPSTRPRVGMCRLETRRVLGEDKRLGAQHATDTFDEPALLFDPARNRKLCPLVYEDSSVATVLGSSNRNHRAAVDPFHLHRLIDPYGVAEQIIEAQRCELTAPRARCSGETFKGEKFGVGALEIREDSCQRIGCRCASHQSGWLAGHTCELSRVGQCQNVPTGRKRKHGRQCRACVCDRVVGEGAALLAAMVGEIGQPRLDHRDGDRPQFPRPKGWLDTQVPVAEVAGTGIRRQPRGGHSPPLLPPLR